jgi:hypothetical protein
MSCVFFFKVYKLFSMYIITLFYLTFSILKNKVLLHTFLFRICCRNFLLCSKRNEKIYDKSSRFFLSSFSKLSYIFFYRLLKNYSLSPFSFALWFCFSFRSSLFCLFSAHFLCIGKNMSNYYLIVNCSRLFYKTIDIKKTAKINGENLKEKYLKWQNNFIHLFNSIIFILYFKRNK